MAEDSVRIDKWLWASRFFKSRGLAADAVKGGKVRVNGQRAKPSRSVRPGDRLRIVKEPWEFHVDVLGVSERRGPAREAEELYRETQASAAARTEQAARRRAERRTAPRPPPGRPDRRDRRALRRLKQHRRGGA